MSFEHIDMIPETPEDYRTIATKHEAAARRFHGAGFTELAHEYEGMARRNRALAARLTRRERRAVTKQAA